ncbi:unnamed protein product [Rotaria sp. Silwood2]|nr:unnamed protein product [Rotaria sp. Silwood2]CAF4857198.1 unnamed protein product [Rotaria sp. Silwood2]
MNHNYPTLDLSTLQEFHRQYREHQAKVSFNQESFSSTQPKSNISSYHGTDDHHHREQSMIMEEEEEFSDENNDHEDGRHSEDKTKVNDEEKRKEEEEEEEDQKWNELIQNYRNHIQQVEQWKKKKP